MTKAQGMETKILPRLVVWRPRRYETRATKTKELLRLVIEKPRHYQRLGYGDQDATKTCGRETKTTSMPSQD